MPILMQGDCLSHSSFRGDAWEGRRGRGQTAEITRRINIGLVNNMPDSALEKTERQFFKRLDAAAYDMSVDLRLFTLPGISRSEATGQHLRRFYRGVGDLLESKLDGLIVTGTEPIATDLRDEPYWGPLTDVLDWAERNTASTMLSCLAAHAAVLHMDGIVRRPLTKKCFGVFDHFNIAAHPLTRGISSRLQIPHSRWNDLDEGVLRSSGYEILCRSDDAGVGLFIKQRRSFFVFFQGHPEYEFDTLFREYRRDVRRYISGKCEVYPSMPDGYFDTATSDVLANFKERAQVLRHENLIREFPDSAIQADGQDTWRWPANCLFRNWLLYLSAAKAQRYECARMTLLS